MFTTKCKCGEEIVFAIEMAMMTKFCPRCGSIIEVRNGKATVIPISTQAPPSAPYTPPVAEPKPPQPTPPVITPRPEPHLTETRSPLERHAEPMERPKPQEPPRSSPVPQQQQQPQHQQPQHPRGEDVAKRHKSAEEEWASIPIKIVEDEGEAARAKGARPAVKPAPHVPHGDFGKTAAPRAPIPPHTVNLPPYQQPAPPAWQPKPQHERDIFVQPRQGAPKTSGCLIALIVAFLGIVFFFIIFAHTPVHVNQNPSEIRSKEKTGVPLMTSPNTGADKTASEKPLPPSPEDYKDKIEIKANPVISEDTATVTFHIKNKGVYKVRFLSFDLYLLDENGGHITTESVNAVNSAVSAGDPSGAIKGLAAGRDFEFKKAFTDIPKTWRGKYLVKITDLRTSNE